MSVNLAPPTDSDKTALNADKAKALASEIIARTGGGECFDADLILEEHPGLAEHRSVVVDLAYEEFCRRLDAGQPPDPQEFVRRFPDVAQSLLKVLEVHQYLDHHPDAFEPAEQAWPQEGEETAGFLLVREIGRGGFSRVFLARERDLGDREVVVKICTHANEEAARLGRLEHPHIVPVHSVQTRPRSGLTLICMPFLGSATLADVVADVFADGHPRPRGADILSTVHRVSQRHGFPARHQGVRSGAIHWTLRRGSYAEAILNTGAELCEALEYAHGQGVCHCDVKPSNVLLTAEGRSLLLDFNLSMQDAGTAAVVGGTLPYMAPEQLRVVLEADARNVPEIDQRTDLFALGATMFQLLTGRLPFPTEDLPSDRIPSARQLLERQRARDGLYGELLPVVSPAVAGLITACLAFDPRDRPQSAAEVARQFRQELGVRARARRWVRTHKSFVSAAAVALVLTVVACGIGLALRPPSHIRHFEVGVAYMEAGDFGAASRCFDQALGSRSDFHEALLLRGWADLKAAQEPGLDKAKRLQLLRDADQAFNLNWNKYKTEQQWLLPEQMNEAIVANRRLRGAAAAASLAWCLTQMEKPDKKEAKIYFAKAADLGLTTPAVLNNLGYLLAQENQLEDAIARLEEAVQMEPMLLSALHNLAVAQWRLALDEGRNARIARKRGYDTVAANHQSRAEELVEAAVANIEVALQQDCKSADLQLAAATIYASAITSLDTKASPERGSREKELLEKALSSCQAAVELHIPPIRLAGLPLAQQLGKDPRFQQLLKRDLPSEPPVPATLLVDVFPDVRDRLGIVHRLPR